MDVGDCIAVDSVCNDVTRFTVFCGVTFSNQQSVVFVTVALATTVVLVTSLPGSDVILNIGRL